MSLAIGGNDCAHQIHSIGIDIIIYAAFRNNLKSINIISGKKVRQIYYMY